MGVVKFSDFLSQQPSEDGSEAQYNPSPFGEGFEPGGNGLEDNRVPGPGNRRKPRKKKRLSPAAVIARSLAPDASELSPVEILANSLDQAFSQFPFEIQKVRPVHEAPRPRPQPQPAEDPFATFWPVWMQHQDYLLKQSLRFMSGNMADAEDALSQAMLKASQNFAHTDIRNERAWLTRLVHNACMDMYRRNSRHNRITDEIGEAPTGEVPTVAPAPLPNPYDSYQMNQTIQELEAQLLDLPASLLQPLVMRCIEERSYQDIAETLGITACSARKRVQLARDRLKDACQGL